VSLGTAPAPLLERPRTKRAGGNSEAYSWLFMRASGVLLIVLVFGHLFVNLIPGTGVDRVSFSFVVGKWENPVWQVWDLLMLFLAELHCANGLRTVINDYAQKPRLRFALQALLITATVVVLACGALTIFTFDPCIDAASTLAQCRAHR